MRKANIFDIKRFGINDGGGIRTVIFIKGCPLACKWCHNPEGISRKIRLWRIIGSCIGCKSCISACTRGALIPDDSGVRMDDTRCDLCGACVRECPTGALKPDAVGMSVDDVMAEIEKDQAFYGETGGVTLGGGECTASPDFSLNVLSECRRRGIHTAIETSMHTPGEVMREFARSADSVIADIKLIDPERHREATGADNGLILKNFEYLARCKPGLLIRIPLIPGYTADGENISGIAAYIAGVNRDVPVELINFNPMCRGKYETLGREFAVEPAAAKPYTGAQMEACREIVRRCGVKNVY
jgi:pyruvate formate lyase activating enzyme